MPETNDDRLHSTVEARVRARKSLSNAQYEHHVPVLLNEVLQLGAPSPGELWVDCTLGFGGHSEALLASDATVVGIDQDPFTLAHTRGRLRSHGESFQTVEGNFRHLRTLLAQIGVSRVDGILADLGVSSKQLDQAERGFSFMHDGPIDMRMSGKGPTAEALIETETTAGLASLIKRNGDEKYAYVIAKAIHRWFESTLVRTTRGLAAVIEEALPARERRLRNHHPATKTFQALRMAINDELGALDDLLDAVPECMAPNGRFLVITFHSLEDRRVKRQFRKWGGESDPVRGAAMSLPNTMECLGRIINRKPMVANDDERLCNPRSRSAKLRGFTFSEVAA